MKQTDPIPFEGINFWCDKCRKLTQGLGYMKKGRGYCEAHYLKEFPEFDTKKGKAFKNTILEDI
jgi:hypothetical protein